MEESVRIDQYLSGEMPAEERRAFEAELGQRPELREALALQQDMAFLLRHGQERQARRAQLDDIGPAYFQASQRRLPLGRIAAAAAAAAVLLLLVWQVFWQPPSLYERYADFPPLALAEKTAGAQDWSEAEQAFNAGDYAAAAQQLAAYVQAFPEDQQARLYLGISYMESGRVAEARDLFLEVMPIAPALRDYAQWYLALSYLKTEDRDEARAVLQSIGPAAPFYDQAQALLDDL